MKYLLALIIGVVIGASLLLAGLYYNPFVAQASVSPIAVTDARVMDLSFSAVPGDGLLYTNDGESAVQPFPERVGELWEASIANSELWVTELQNSRGIPVGLGVKFSTRSEETELIRGEAMTNSIWHVYLPDRGTFVIDQTENYWSYIRDVVIPARWSSGDNWRGTYNRITTAGPGSLGTGRLTGGSGQFADLIGESVETLTARAYSVQSGPVSMTGNLTMALPVQAASQ
ncbi:MAG: hypothetical protein ACR2Q3_02220 [Woeseiaceae bacterium]